MTFRSCAFSVNSLRPCGSLRSRTEAASDELEVSLESYVSVVLGNALLDSYMLVKPVLIMLIPVFGEKMDIQSRSPNGLAKTFVESARLCTKSLPMSTRSLNGPERESANGSTFVIVSSYILIEADLLPIEETGARWFMVLWRRDAAAFVPWGVVFVGLAGSERPRRSSEMELLPGAMIFDSHKGAIVSFVCELTEDGGRIADITGGAISGGAMTDDLREFPVSNRTDVMAV